MYMSLLCTCPSYVHVHLSCTYRYTPLMYMYTSYVHVPLMYMYTSYVHTGIHLSCMMDNSLFIAICSYMCHCFVLYYCF